MDKVYLICNAHIDPVWLWTADEGKAAALSTFRSAANLLENNDFVFCHNESVLYEFIERVDPELFEKIKKHVKAGKWKIMGGWYLQSDCLIPSGETFVRLIRHGQNYFRNKFGVEPSIALNGDSFGHSVGLVQILAKTGYNGYIVCRPHWHLWPAENDWLTWEGLDGSSIKVVRDNFHYSSAMGDAVEKIKKTIAYHDEKGKKVGFCLWGVGDHGGGPSQKDLNDIARYMKESSVEVVHSCPEEAMANTSVECTYDDSLITVFPGAYTSVRAHKSKFAELQQKLLFTEKICSVAEMFYGMTYPMERLKKVCKKLIWNTFHDTLAGTCSEIGMKQTIDDLSYGLSELTEISAEAMLAMSRNIRFCDDGSIPLCVFNPHPYKTHTVAEGEFMLPKIFWDKNSCKLTVKDENGNIVLSQNIKESSNFNVHWQKRVAFECELEPFSVKKYDVYFEFADEEEREPLKDCNLVSFFVYDDNEDPWGQAAEQYVCMGKNPVQAELTLCRIVENGDLFTVYEKQYRYGTSKIICNEKYYRDSDKIDIDIRTYWSEENKMLKMHVAACQGEYIGQIPYGTTTLYNDGRECCAHYFTGVKTKDGVFGLLNNGVFGSSYKDGVIMMSLLRSGCYAAHPATDEDTGIVRPLVDGNRFVPHFDQGLSEFSFRIIKTKEELIDRETDEFNQKPYSITVATYGTEKNICPDIRIDGDTVTLVAFKKSEEVNGYILRVMNNCSSTKRAIIHVKGFDFTYDFGKYEVATFIYDGKQIYKSKQLII